MNFLIMLIAALNVHANQTWSVYAAGPLFNAPEREEMALITLELERANFQVFLPQRDGMEFASVLPQIVAAGYSPEDAARMLGRAIDALDTFKVVTSDALVVNLNGRVPDEGSVAELSMAWILGKPCVIYNHDIRTLTNGMHNPLVMGRADFDTVATYGEIPNVLRQKLKRARLPILAPNVRRVVDAGKSLWEVLSTIPRDSVLSQQRLAAVVIERFAQVCQASLEI